MHHASNTLELMLQDDTEVQIQTVVSDQEDNTSPRTEFRILDINQSIEIGAYKLPEDMESVRGKMVKIDLWITDKIKQHIRKVKILIKMVMKIKGIINN